ncbi:Tripartite motif-containing protein 59 [Holothuria leucospilota]|uniref:Tripartite motif-containing protein 59 n=1 Tax=Holothuria leucospilota TaxID=206669 RepID=A0A9Q1CQC3_HOLLE|nr:Tripartite motif-containing protein 59 [Holothuria leucospilota]
MAEATEIRLEPAGRTFRCPVCLETFKNPKVLSCGHSFCLEPCLTHVKDNENFLKCPECRVATQIPSDGLESLPTNFSLLRAINEGPVSVPDRKVCDEHKKVLQLRCYTCEKDICSDCLENGHSSEEHDTDASRVIDVIGPVRRTLEDFHRMMSEKLAAVVDSEAAEEHKRIKTAQSIERSAELAMCNIHDMKNALLQNLNDISEADAQQFVVEKMRYQSLMDNAEELRNRVNSLADAMDSRELERLDDRKYIERAVVSLYNKVIPAYERPIPKKTKVVVFIPNKFTADIGELKIAPRPPPRTPPVAKIREY